VYRVGKQSDAACKEDDGHLKNNRSSQADERPFDSPNTALSGEHCGVHCAVRVIMRIVMAVRLIICVRVFAIEQRHLLSSCLASEHYTQIRFVQSGLTARFTRRRSRSRGTGCYTPIH